MLNTRTAYSSYYPAIYRGIVESSDDPKSLGRCKIRVPSVHGELTYPIDNLPWARPVVNHAVSNGRGSVSLPSVGDIVWVVFEGANKEFPVYLGGTYGEGELEVDSSRVDFYIDGGNRITYDKSGAFLVTIGSTQLIVQGDKVTIIGDTGIQGNLVVQGNLNVEGNLDVAGTTRLSSLTVSGTATFQGTVNLNE